VFTLDGMRICHLGRPAGRVRAEQAHPRSARVDLIFIDRRGSDDRRPAQEVQIVQQLAPAVVVPDALAGPRQSDFLEPPTSFSRPLRCGTA